MDYSKSPITQLSTLAVFSPLSAAAVIAAAAEVHSFVGSESEILLPRVAVAAVSAATAAKSSPDYVKYMRRWEHSACSNIVPDRTNMIFGRRTMLPFPSHLAYPPHPCRNLNGEKTKRKIVRARARPKSISGAEMR